MAVFSCSYAMVSSASRSQLYRNGRAVKGSGGFSYAIRNSLPPVDLQHDFASGVSRIFDWVECSEKVRRKIDELFSALLHRAFTGDLTAKWREAHMKELLQEMEQQAKTLGSVGVKGI